MRFRTRDGRLHEQALSGDAQAVLLSELLHSHLEGFIEVVGVRRRVDGRLGRFERWQPENFVRVGERERLLERVRFLRGGEHRELFFTPATLRVPVAGNDSVASAAVAWVDIDDPRRLAALRAFEHAPHAVVASGSGGAHAYWRLSWPLPGEQCEALNRMLAAALGADPASCNRGRIMRVPGSLNWKPAIRGRPPAWCRIVMCDLARAPYDPAKLGVGLSDPKSVPPPRRLPRPAPAGEEPWVGMESADYYRAITGLEPGRDGKVRCPSAVHEDRHPSAHLYRGPGAGWYCFACQAGGSAVDMIAALRGWPTGRALREDQFRDCVEELRGIFGATTRRPSEGER